MTDPGLRGGATVTAGPSSSHSIVVGLARELEDWPLELSVLSPPTWHAQTGTSHPTRGA